MVETCGLVTSPSSVSSLWGCSSLSAYAHVAELSFLRSMCCSPSASVASLRRTGLHKLVLKPTREAPRAIDVICFLEFAVRREGDSRVRVRRKTMYSTWSYYRFGYSCVRVFFVPSGHGQLVRHDGRDWALQLHAVQQAHYAGLDTHAPEAGTVVELWWALLYVCLASRTSFC